MRLYPSAAGTIHLVAKGFKHPDKVLNPSAAGTTHLVAKGFSLWF